MLAAATRNDAQRFRDFQFLFATTLVHEAGGHLFMGFLWKGRLLTPPHISAPGYGSQAGVETSGEAGRWLELRLFGGTTEYYRDLSQDDQQAWVPALRPFICQALLTANSLIKTGVPHQLDGIGQAWKLDPNTISQVCEYRACTNIKPFSHLCAPRTLSC